MDARQTDRDQTPISLFAPSVCVCNPKKQDSQCVTVQFSWCLHIYGRCKNRHCSVGGLLCAILVTMCTGGYPGVAGTPGASQRHHPCFQLDRVLNTEWSAFYLVMLEWVLLRVVFQLDRVSVKHRVIFTWSC